MEMVSLLNRRATDVQWIIWSRKGAGWKTSLLTRADWIGGISAPNEVFTSTAVDTFEWIFLSTTSSYRYLIVVNSKDSTVRRITAQGMKPILLPKPSHSAVIAVTLEIKSLPVLQLSSFKRLGA
jgi:hypothetical protein